MKLLFFVGLLSVACAGNVNWSSVKPRHMLPRIPSGDFKTGGKIVGGNEATPNEFPYQAALLLTADDGMYFCGGSLISQNYVLTAAHCLDDMISVEVVLGAHRVQEEEPTQRRYVSTEFFTHPGYFSLLLIHDVGLVKLPESVPLDENIQIIAMPTYLDIITDFYDMEATISGWGLDSDSSTTISPVLRYVNVDVITNLVCNLSYLGIIQTIHICTAGDDARGACSGDSGGPLVVPSELFGRKQIGIASFVISLGCEAGWPTGYTRVTSYLDWIAANSDARIY